MLEIVKDKHLAVESDGALVVPVQEETDTKEMPPCILLKSDGATLYATTDLATIVQREQDFHPGKILYLTDKRQSLHFEQVFRVARKAALVPPTTELAAYWLRYDERQGRQALQNARGRRDAAGEL